jgi:hypothetical protein
LAPVPEATASSTGEPVEESSSRLLFLLYVEARPELSYAPMDSDEYLNGYSLERLRDLELVDLSTEQAKSGHYLHHSIERLFSLIYNGYPAVETNGEAHRGDGQVAADFEEDSEAGPSTTPSASSRCAPISSTRSRPRF